MSEVRNPLKGLTNHGWHFEQEIFSPFGLARSIKAGGGSGNIPKVIEIWTKESFTREGSSRYGGGCYTNVGNPSFYRGGLAGLSRALRAEQHDASVCIKTNDMAKVYRIRKLSPRECFRLMGCTDSDIDKIQSAGISESQQYKLAGNSIVVDVMFYMFDNLFFGSEPQEGEAYTQLFYD